MYRVGFPGWKIAARFGSSLLVKIDVLRDDEAGVFVATSRDLPGLVVEAKDMDQLFPEVYGCVDMLLSEQLKSAPKRRPIAAWDGAFCPA
jgi:hypothetical protein